MTPAQFIRANAVVGHPPACPEVKLWLATEVTPLWEATEAVLEQNNLPPPYWAFCWAGGQALTRWALDNPEVVAGKRVLDFAAGSGVTAVAAAMKGAARVEAAEIDPFAVAAIGLNAELNGVHIDGVEGDIVGQPNRWDVVFAGDVCYERPMTDHIWPWLKKLAADGALVVMADPGRAYLPKHGLLRLAAYTVPTSLELEDRTEREVGIYRIVG
ncbi:MAG: class I SAM-dependent methyltransferase [Actinomycetota bacterium]